MALIPAFGNTKIISPVFAIVAAVFFMAGCKSSTKAGNKAATVEVGSNLLDSAALIKHLAFLTSDQAAGRESGTAGNAMAREYIVHLFDSLGGNRGW